MKVSCQKWKVKLISRGAYRLSGTGIVECLEIVDVGCNWWLDPTDTDPHILRQIDATVGCSDHNDLRPPAAQICGQNDRK